jgi:DNA-binding MarR family transcriptional regulator
VTSDAAFRSLIRVGLLVRRVMEPYFAPFGITPAQWGALRTLHRAAAEGLAELRLTDLGDRMLVRPPSVTTLVDRLERLGLVSRTASADDLRAKYIRLTPAGRQLVETIRKGHAARVRAVLGGLSAGEQTQLHGLLDRLGSHLESLVDGQNGAPATAAKARLLEE